MLNMFICGHQSQEVIKFIQVKKEKKIKKNVDLKKS